MKILLIVNSAASSVTARRRVVIQKALAADHQVTLADTSRRGHAARLAQGAAATRTDVVVVLGGDGTLNEAANGLVGTDTALAALPGGSTNVFARTLGLPDDPVEATAATLEALAAESIRPVGLGSVNGRYFLFHCGVGYDAAVVEAVERRGSLKRYASHALFAYAALETWARRYERTHRAFTLTFADGREVTGGQFGIFLNTNPYTYLGTRPFDVAPEAGLDRPLTVVTLRSLRSWRLVPIIGSALRGGGVRPGKWVDVAPDVHEVTLEAPGPVPYQVDGDHLGAVARLRFRWEPDVLRLVTLPSG